MIVTQVWGWREMWGEWGEGRHNTEPTQYWISHRNRWLLHRSGGDGRCGGSGGKDVTILNLLNIEYHTEIDDCYTGLGVTGDVGGMGGRTLQYWTNSILNITQKSMIVTQVWGWREMWGEWGEGRHNTEPTQYWISHRNRWLLHRSGGDGRCGGSGGKDVTILNLLNIEYHTEIDDCYTGLGVTGDVGGVGGRTSQYWTYSILNITQKSMIVTQVWGWREMWGEWGEGRHNTEPTQYWISHRNRWLLHRSGGDGRCGGMGGRTSQYWTYSILNITQKSMIVTQVWGREMWGDVTILNLLNIEYHTEIDDCYTGLGVTGDVGGREMGGRTSQYWTNSILNITQKSMIVTQVWGWREMWGEWGEGRHNTEPTQYWISHRNRWLLHRSGGDGRCGGNGGKDVTILNLLNIEYHTEIDDCYTGLGVTGDVGGVGGRTSQYWTNSILNITQKSMIVTQVWGWREMWGEWGEGRHNTEPTQYWISHRNRWLLHRSGGDGRCGGSGGKDVTILNQLNIEYHTEIDDCYTGLGVTGDVGGVGGRTSQYWTYSILNITQKSMIVTQVWGWREMWGEWGEGRHNTEPTQYWISHRNRWLLHRSGGDGRCGGSGGKDVTILNLLNIEYHTEIDDCYTGLGVTGDVGGVGGRTSQYWTYSILNITQKSMIVTQVWGWREMWGEWGEGRHNTEPTQYWISHRNRWLLHRSGGDGRCGGSGGKDVTILNQLNIEYHTEIDDCYTGLGVTGDVGGVGGVGGKDVTILNLLNIEYHTEIDDCYTGLGVTGDVGGVGGRTSQYWTYSILNITQKSMIVTQVWGWREMWGEWGEGRHNTEPTQYWISHRNRWLLHRSGGDGRCGGSGGKDVTILNLLNIEYHTEIDDCYTGLGVTGDVGGVGGRTSQYWTYSILNITQKSMIVTQVWGWREMWGEWGEGRHNTEPTQYWISHRNRWLLHRSGGDGRCGGSGGKDVTILNLLNIEYHTEIDDCYTGLGVTGDVGGVGGRTLQYWTYSILNITQKSMIVTQVWSDGRCGGSGRTSQYWTNSILNITQKSMIVTQVWGDGRCGGRGEGRHNTEPTQYWISHRNRWLLHRSGGDGRCGGSGGKDVTILNQLNIEYHTEIDDCYTGLGVTGDVGGVGGRTSQYWTYSILNITQKSMIVTQVWGWREMWGEWGEGRHNTEPTQYWISHRNRWLLHRSGGDGRCGGSGGKDVTILNQLNIEYHTEIDDCYTGLGVTGDVGGVGGRTSQYWTNLILNITQKSMIVTQVWGWRGMWGEWGKGRHNTEPT